MAAEVAIIASFSTIVAGGVKLSISLYDFGSTLGHAGEDMKDLGTEVSIFCAVMRQVHSSLAKAKSFRISSTAIQDVQDVLDQGNEIFKKIHSLLAKLHCEDKSTPDIFSRVKWTFKKTKVLMLKESLRSCTAMIHVMLTTMIFAERIASTQTSTPAAEVEDEQLREMMQSLLLVQHNTNLRLEKLEDQAILEETENADGHVPGIPESPNAGAQISVQRWLNHRHMHSITRDVEVPKDRSQRTSVFINGKIFQSQDLRESQRRTLAGIGDQRLSVIQTNDLLENWTDQSDPLVPYCLPDSYAKTSAPQATSELLDGHQPTRSGNSDQDLQQLSLPESGSVTEIKVFCCELGLSGKIDIKNCDSVHDAIALFLFQFDRMGLPREFRLWAPQQRHSPIGIHFQEITNAMLAEIRVELPTSKYALFILKESLRGPPTLLELEAAARGKETAIETYSAASNGNASRSSGLGRAPEPAKPTEPPSVEIFKSFRVSLEDPCWKVLPAALRKYNIQADWWKYALYIVYDDQERVVSLEEKPLTLFKDLDKEGKKPLFMLRKLVSPIGTSKSVASIISPGAGGSNASPVKSQPGTTSLNASETVDVDSRLVERAQTLGSDQPSEPESDTLWL